MVRPMRILTLAVAAFAAATVSAPAAAQSIEASLPEIRKGFQDWMLDNRVPGLVWGVVKDGKLVAVEGMGVQDLEARRPVTADSAFRIASMSKAFTAYGVLRLEAEGKLSLSDPAAKHVPEMSAWATGITVGDLMHHTAGFVTDDPWGDRQQVRTPAEFTAMLKAGVPFSTAPGSAYEYSNFGYATLGRTISNVSGKPYQRWVGENIFRPLGMASTTYDVFKALDGRYRWRIWGLLWATAHIMGRTRQGYRALMIEDGMWADWRSRLALYAVLLRIFSRLTPRFLRILLPGYDPRQVADPAWAVSWWARYGAAGPEFATLDMARIAGPEPVPLGAVA